MRKAKTTKRVLDEQSGGARDLLRLVHHHQNMKDSHTPKIPPSRDTAVQQTVVVSVSILYYD